jgi:asparagine synthase (glutamine-hydrolysing)
MCGIFGSVGDPLGTETVSRVIATIHHRGPDLQGARELPGATLIHTRLRIIDLSPAAAQPMSNEDGSVWVTFNGEIYNFKQLRRELEARGHRFRSQSDTETLVHGYEQWGEELPRHLDGMFAFGIWDIPRRSLFLARDRTGKKPLFYATSGGRFQFASEIKALFAAGLPVEVDHDGLAGMLAYGYAPPPGTLYRQVWQLPPAHQLVLSADRKPRVTPYWSVDFRPRDRPVSESEAAEQVRELLTAAVRKRLVADVPIGAFLSGGLDSTIVVGLMSASVPRVRTFSIGFAGDPRYDETHYARLAARAFGTDHTEFRVTPSDFQLVEKLVWQHDGPFGDSSAIPTYVVSRLTRQEVTVALNGDGGDELFAGYLRFWAAAITERVPGPLRQLAGQAARLLPGGTGSRTFTARARRMLSAMGRPLGDRLVSWNSYFAFTLDEILRPDVPVDRDSILQFQRRYFATDAADAGAGGGRRRWSALAAALQHNFGTYLPHDLLVKVDRMSMAHALETRSPFLDTALMEYVAGLPDSYKLRGRTTKYILRRAFADLMPPAIRSRGKMGFGLPLGTWFRGDLRSYVQELITAPDARIGEYLRPETVSRVFREHVEGRADHEHQLWLLITMELWLRNLPRLRGAWSEATASAGPSLAGLPPGGVSFPPRSPSQRPDRAQP